MPARKSPGRPKSPKRRSPTKSPVKAVEKVVNMVDYQPTKEVFMVMHALSLVLVLGALASAIAFIYYVAKASEDNQYGTDSSDEVFNSQDVCFYSVVISALLYFVSRHHFSHGHY